MLRNLLLCIVLVSLTLVGKSQPVNFTWAESMGGKGTYDGNIGMEKDASGNIYISGEFNGTRTFGPFSLTALGYTDVFVAKYTSTGTCLWAVRGGAMFSTSYASRLVVNGNDLFVTGSFTNIIDFNGQAISSYGSKDIFVAGFDQSNGNCLWINKAGSTFDDVPHGMTPGIGGGFFICGTFTGTATFGTNVVSSSSMIDFDMFVASYSATGVCNWVTRAGSTGIDIAFALKQIPNGGILVTGSYEGTVTFAPGFTFTSSGYSDYFWASFSSSGTLLTAFSGGGDNNDVGYAIDTDGAGNIFTTGFIADTATFGGINVNNAGNIQVCTIKYDVWGTIQWVRTGGNINDDIGFDLVADNGGSVYVTGFINGNAVFSGIPVNGVSGNDAFVVKYDPSGALRWITKIGGLNMDRGKCIIEESNGFCFAAGDFADNAAFGSTGLYTDPGITGIYLTRIGGGTVGINEVEKIPFRAYPNPASDFVYLDLEKISDDAFTLSLYSTDGRLVQSRLLTHNDARPGYRYELGNLPSGNYVLRLETSKGDFNVSLLTGK